MTQYKGVPMRTPQGRFQVFRDDVPLPPERSQKVVNHSPDGFAWGYGGSGPLQLALALLLEETDESLALDFYQEFEAQVIARFPSESSWLLSSETILTWIKVDYI